VLYTSRACISDIVRCLRSKLFRSPLHFSSAPVLRHHAKVDRDKRTAPMPWTQDLFDTAHEAALVTGAGNGIGRAVAQALVAAGVRTVFADIDPARVDAAVAGSARPDLAVGWVGDLAEPPAWEALLMEARSRVGVITRLVHSASPPRHEKDNAFAVDDETWRRMRSVNVDAGFHLARAVARGLMAEKKPGAMLFLTSLHAETPRNLPHYSTSKAAMAMLVKELAKGLGRHGIRVNALVPGAIAAGGFVADPALARHIPLGRLGRAEDLAPMALAVLSDRVSGYVTGTSIVVDGGLALTNWFDPPVLE
jgi:NAD(P)-dependent dehydrogenase (short-subunit alcohol dehydrogenase family)